MGTHPCALAQPVFPALGLQWSLKPDPAGLTRPHSRAALGLRPSTVGSKSDPASCPPAARPRHSLASTPQGCCLSVQHPRPRPLPHHHCALVQFSKWPFRSGSLETSRPLDGGDTAQEATCSLLPALSVVAAACGFSLPASPSSGMTVRVFPRALRTLLVGRPDGTHCGPSLARWHGAHGDVLSRDKEEVEQFWPCSLHGRKRGSPGNQAG